MANILLFKDIGVHSFSYGYPVGLADLAAHCIFSLGLKAISGMSVQGVLLWHPSLYGSCMLTFVNSWLCSVHFAMFVVLSCAYCTLGGKASVVVGTREMC